jgi:glycosyltransferase EpsD
MRWFKEQGYEVHYASAGEEEVLDCDKHFTIPFERSPFRINNLKSIRQLKKIIDAEDYDIIHAHTPMGSVITRLAAKEARRNGTRVIYTAHGFHFFKGAPMLNWLIFYPIEKILANYTDTLITINKEDYELAKSKFKTDVRYVPGVGIDSKKFDISMTQQQKTELRKSLGIKDSDFVMIYPAELNKNKNQLWLIKSLANLIKNNSKLHLLLPGKDSLNGKCQSLMNKLGLENNVHFLGYRTDVVQLLKISDLSVSSSLREGLPVNIMEAMYVGLPVVATSCRGNRDLIQDGLNGYIIRPNDLNGFVDRVTRLESDRDVVHKMVCENKRKVKGYLLDKILINMHSVYATIPKPPTITIIKESGPKKHIYYAGDFLSNNGPSNVNKRYEQYIKNDVHICHSRIKLLRITHFMYRILFSDKVLVSGISKFHLNIIMMSKALNKETFYLMHGYDAVEHKINGITDTKYGLLLEQKILDYCDNIICVSKSFAEFLKKVEPSLSGKITFVNNGVDKMATPIEKTENNDRFTIISVGGGVPRKNNLTICKAIEKLNNKKVRFIVIGDKNKDGDKISKYPFVEYYEYMPHDKVLEEIQKSDLYIQNSSFETFGLAVCEAVSVRCNVLISQNIGAISIIDGLNNDNTIKHTNDTDEISRKIEHLLTQNTIPTICFKNHSLWRNSATRLLNIIGSKDEAA